MWGRTYPFLILIIFGNIFKASCEGKSSLALVIDDTGSMRGDIGDVKANANKILDIVFNEISSLIKNMVLVTINDPGSKLKTVTTSRNDFQRALNNVQADRYNPFNRDCPEPSMKGIILALNNSLPDSYVYVFTDASSKDYYDVTTVIEMCQKKQTQIVFVLTGHCPIYDILTQGKSFKVFYDIATACTGMVIIASKKNVKEVMRTIEETIKGNKTVIGSWTTPAKTYTNIPFRIDDQTEYVIVSASGMGVYLNVTGPNSATGNQEWIMYQDNGKVLKISYPTPGQYIATVNGKKEVSVIVTGRTDFFFSHGFSVLQPRTMGDTSKQPIADTKVYLSISVTDPKHSVEIESAQILEMNESPIQGRLVLTQKSKDFYVTEPFVVPSKMFKVAVKGTVIATGQPIRRIAKIPVTPSEPPIDKTKPTAYIVEGESTEVEYDSTVKLTCKVTAYPNPKIEWINGRGVKMTSKSSVLKEPYKHISYMTITNVVEGDSYVCNAVNHEGKDTKSIKVLVKDPLVVKSTPAGTTKIVYGTEGTLTCNIKSAKPIQIHWYYADKSTRGNRQIVTSDKYWISADGTQMKIRKMDLNLVGKYTCKVSLIKNEKVEKSFSTQVKIDGLIIPKITGPAYTKAIKGTTAVLSCQVTNGVPKPKITWQFMEKSSSKFAPIAGSDSVLRIPSVQHKHAGIYKCIADNFAGKDEHDTALIIQEAPQVSGEAAKKATVGTTTSIECTIVKGAPKPNISWQFMDKSSSKFAAIAGSDSVLRIPSVQYKHAGIYKCIAENVAGKDEHDTALIVQELPKITTNRLTDYQGIEGNAYLNIPCTATGFPKPVITWKLNGRAITQNAKYDMKDNQRKFEYLIEVDRSLVIRDPKVSDTNSYTCEATNEVGSVSATFQARIRQVPEVSGEATKKATVGTTTSIECTIVKGAPKPNIFWQFMDKSSSKFAAIAGSDSVLRIPSVQHKHAGIYKCIAENVAGKDEHDTALIVQELPKITTNRLTDYQGIEGNAYLNIPCTATGFPKPVITWKLNGRAITQNAKYDMKDNQRKFEYLIEVDRSLVIRDPKVSDTNSYTCEATNEVGSVSATFQARIRQAPQVSGEAAKKAIMGTTTSIVCTIVKGEPKPNISWQFMDKSSSKFASIAGSDSVLRIPSVQDKHAGIYKCIAENVAGKDEHDTTLIIQVPPKITTNHLQVYQGVEGDDHLSIPCITTGSPKPVITWKIDGVSIFPSAKYNIVDGTLVIKDPKVSDTNSYTCEAKNEAGSISATFQTRIHQAPKILGVGGNNKKARVGTSATIVCKVLLGVPTPTITWQFKNTSTSNFAPIAGSEEELHISTAEKKHAGQYRCVAQNSVGNDELVTTLVVEYPPEINTTKTLYEGIEGDLALRIPCDVVGVPQPEITWKYKGATITPSAMYSIGERALVIMNPTESNTSYVCEAKNYVGSVSATFQAEVSKTLDSFGKISHEYLLVGETRKLTCDGYTSKSQSVKWFKEDTIIEDNDKPYIQLVKVTEEADGNYTCRVSDKHGNTHTYTYVVDVGIPPTLHLETPVDDWRGDISEILTNCATDSAKPNADVTWTFNGQVLSDQNVTELGISYVWGHYTCNVSNVHGSVLRSFDVKSSACLISRNLRDAEHMPLLLSNGVSWPTWETTDHYSVVNKDDNMTLSCPNHKETLNAFQKFPKQNEIKATCIEQDIFSVDGKTYKLSELQCTAGIYPSVIRKKVKCSTETSELIRVGYNVAGFLETYEVCFDHAKNMPQYIRTLITNKGTSVTVTAPYDWYKYPGIGEINKATGLTCKDAVSSCCYSKSQLVSARDFNDGPAKNSTFIDPLNVISSWRPCNKSKTSWEDIDRMVRGQLNTHDEFIVWSGVHTLQEMHGAFIPRYLWKVLMFNEEESMAIVHVNNPSPTVEDIKCTNICTPEEEPWFQPSDKYTYCCSTNEFLERFHMDGTGFTVPFEDALRKIESRT